MKADNIQQVIHNLSDLPYRAVLFDGVWGIGKSYAVNEAVEGNLNVCKISMFGLKDTQQIYHEALFQLALKNNVGGKIGEIADNVLDGLSRVWEKVGQAKAVVQSIANERELFLLLSKEFTSLHIIVIEDLERMKKDLNLEEVFGVIEELKQCNYVKVILVANTKELNQEQKELFEKYREKVIERTYQITEHAEHVAWSRLGIQADFIEKFLSSHKVKNLRTLEKAQRFYEDVKLFCEEIKNEQFQREVQLICFAIVVESIENLYYREPDANETDHTKRIMQELSNSLEHRIREYLYGIKSNGALMEMLLKYYQEGIFDKEQLNAGYKLFVQAGEKPDYCKTDEEIKKLLTELRESVLAAENITELNQFADSYIYWGDILEEDTEEVLKIYREILNRMLKEQVKNGKEEILEHSYALYHLSAGRLEQIYNEEIAGMREFVIETYVDYLKQITGSEKAYKYSQKLREYFESSFYRGIIKEKAEELYQRKAFPVDEVNELRYYTCYNIMYVLYHDDKEKFLRYCEELKRKCDKMSWSRIQSIVKEIAER